MSLDTADHLRDANPWRAEPDHIKLAILGKLAEELGELMSAVSRCIIQGVDGAHPVTGKPNTDWLWEEMIDVQNMMIFLRRVAVEPDAHFWITRMERKRAHIDQWLAAIK